MKKKLLCALFSGILASSMVTTTFAAEGNFSSPKEHTDYLYEKYNGDWGKIIPELTNEYGIQIAFAMMQQKMREEIGKETDDILNDRENGGISEPTIPFPDYPKPPTMPLPPNK